MTLSKDEFSHHLWPFILPGSIETVVFVISRTDNRAAVRPGSSPCSTSTPREVTRLGLAGVSPHYVSTGHLVYGVEDGSVRAVPFDAASLEVIGNPVPLVEGVIVKASGAADFEHLRQRRGWCICQAAGRT